MDVRIIIFVVIVAVVASYFLFKNSFAGPNVINYAMVYTDSPVDWLPESDVEHLGFMYFGYIANKSDIHGSTFQDYYDRNKRVIDGLYPSTITVIMKKGDSGLIYESLKSRLEGDFGVAVLPLWI